MVKIEVMTRLPKCNNNNYTITARDVMNAVEHLKTGKFGRPNGLTSVSFIYDIVGSAASEILTNCRHMDPPIIDL